MVGLLARSGENTVRAAKDKEWKMAFWPITLRRYILTFSPRGLLHVAMGRPLSSCATHFDLVPCLPSSCTHSCPPWYCPTIIAWASPFCSFLALACLTSSWWYPPLPSWPRGHTIAVVSSWGTLSLARHWLLSTTTLNNCHSGHIYIYIYII